MTHEPQIMITCDCWSFVKLFIFDNLRVETMLYNLNYGLLLLLIESSIEKSILEIASNDNDDDGVTARIYMYIYLYANAVVLHTFGALS